MTTSILIISLPIDIHAFAVAEALRHKGASPSIWCTSDFPNRSGETIRYLKGRRSIRVTAPSMEIEDESFFSVWHRRLLSAPDRALLHPGDRAFATQQCEVFRRRMLEAVSPESFWVNSPKSSHFASQKISQHHEALRSGLIMPDTIFSNDPIEIRNFIRDAGGRVVSKTLTPASWRDDEDRYWTPYTMSLTESDLVADDLLRQTPAIFQVEVEKAYEVRMTVMGREVFAAKIRSQDTSKGRLDWRLAYDELVMEKIDVPGDIAEQCFSLMEHLGIVFGCFDFMITPKSEWIFLEVNEMGQFLFIESYTGMPLLDAFAEFLLSGERDFRWTHRKKLVCFSDIHAPVREAMIANARDHVQADSLRFYEGSKAEV